MRWEIIQALPMRLIQEGESVAGAHLVSDIRAIILDVTLCDEPPLMLILTCVLWAGANEVQVECSWCKIIEVDWRHSV